VDAKLLPVSLGPYNFACWSWKGGNLLVRLFFEKPKKFKQGGRLKVSVGHEILCSDRSFKDKQPLIGLFFLNEKYERRGQLKVKIRVCFMETTRGPLNLNNVWCSKRTWTYYAFYLNRYVVWRSTSMAMLRNLRLCSDKLWNALYKSVTVCSVIPLNCLTCYYILYNSALGVISSLLLKPQFHFMAARDILRRILHTFPLPEPIF
jgi:hypothetical protein